MWVKNEFSVVIVERHRQFKLDIWRLKCVSLLFDIEPRSQYSRLPCFARHVSLHFSFFSFFEEENGEQHLTTCRVTSTVTLFLDSTSERNEYLKRKRMVSSSIVAVLILKG